MTTVTTAPAAVRDTSAPHVARAPASRCRAYGSYLQPALRQMHSLVRRYIKTAVAFLAVGLSIGGWMIVRRELYGRYPAPYLVSAHTHALFVGFVMMMILGVALWLFPRPEKGDERYSPRVANAAYWVLTAATALRVGGELLRSGVDFLWLRLLVAAAGLGQIVGILLFFHTIWTRIRPVGSAAREAKGERF